METLKELVSKHRFVRNGMRINLDNDPDNVVREKCQRKWLRRGPYRLQQHSTGPEPPYCAARADYVPVGQLRLPQPQAQHQPADDSAPRQGEHECLDDMLLG